MMWQVILIYSLSNWPTTYHKNLLLEKDNTAIIKEKLSAGHRKVQARSVNCFYDEIFKL